jgi:hypothetical protein
MLVQFIYTLRHESLTRTTSRFGAAPDKSDAVVAEFIGPSSKVAAPPPEDPLFK